MDNNDKLLTFQRESGMDDLALCMDIMTSSDWDLERAFEVLGLPLPDHLKTTNELDELENITDDFERMNVEPSLNNPPTDFTPDVEPGEDIEPFIQEQFNRLGRSEIPNSNIFQSHFQGFDSSQGESQSSSIFQNHFQRFVEEQINLPQTYSNGPLNINVHDASNDRRYKFQLEHSVSIHELKQLMAIETGVPSEHQEILMFNENCRNERSVGSFSKGQQLDFVMKIATSDVTVNGKETRGNVKDDKEDDYHARSDDDDDDDEFNDTLDLIDSSDDDDHDDDDDDFDDADFDNAVSSNFGNQKKFLIHYDKNLTDEQCSFQFREKFYTRFCSESPKTTAPPKWHVGSFANAVAESRAQALCLFILLYDSNNIEANMLCSTLCNPEVSRAINSNCICWGWDISSPELTNRLQDSVGSEMNYFTPELSCTVLLYEPSGTTFVDRTDGFMNINQAMGMIAKIYEHDHTLTALRREKETREQARLLKEDQDRAYKLSLQEDREKELQRAELLKFEEEKRQKDELEQAEKEEIEMRKKKEAEDQVSEEPDSTCTHPISKIRFKFPDGQIINRRFLADNKVKDLVLFGASKGYSSDEYELVVNFPRRVLNKLETNATLKETKLFPSEVIHVQEI